MESSRICRTYHQKKRSQSWLVQRLVIASMRRFIEPKILTPASLTNYPAFYPSYSPTEVTSKRAVPRFRQVVDVEKSVSSQRYSLTSLLQADHIYAGIEPPRPPLRRSIRRARRYPFPHIIRLHRRRAQRRNQAFALRYLSRS